MKIVNGHLAAKVRLVSPNTNGYLMLAAEVGTWAGPLVMPNRRRRALLNRLVTLTRTLADHDEVEVATVFRGILRPRARGPSYGTSTA